MISRGTALTAPLRVDDIADARNVTELPVGERVAWAKSYFAVPIIGTAR